MPQPQPTAPASPKPVVLLGGGGHARVLLDVLALTGRAVRGLLDDDPAVTGSDQAQRLGGIEALKQLDPSEIELINAIGSANLPTIRQAVYEHARAAGFRFAPVLHPDATIARLATLGPGVQVLAQSVVGPGTTLGENVLINTRSSVDHDCTVGPHTHLAPGVTVCGSVRIGAGCHIGSGATIIQGVTLGDGVLVAAGAVVTKDVADGQRVAGVPARAF